MGQTQDSSAQNSSIYIDSDPAHLAYLMSQVGKFEFRNTRSQYPKPAVRPQRPRPAHNLTASQKLSFEFLKTYVHDLSEGFTATELKKAFRQTAIILHPDRGGSAELFIELKAHYEELKAVVPQQAAK